jgi:uncharacterized protein (TIGR02118 family)
MVKLVYCITRRADLSFEEFSCYWQQVHGPIGARIPGLRRLVQSHVIPESRNVRPADYDGMAELWFDDLPSLLSARETLEYELSSTDEANFIDGLRTAFFITEEREIEIPGRD